MAAARVGERSFLSEPLTLEATDHLISSAPLGYGCSLRLKRFKKLPLDQLALATHFDSNC